MKKVYVTDSTFKKLISVVEISEYIETKLPCYEKLRFILSIPERKYLVKYSDLMEDFEDFKNYNKIDKKYENNPKTRLVFYEKKPPVFHLIKECKYLNSDYENYEIPVEIKDTDIENYRNFFLKNKKSYKENRVAFLAKVEIKFNVVIRNVKEIHGQNSGIEETHNFKLEHPEIILNRISSLIFEMENYRHESIERNNLIERVGFGTHRAKHEDKNGNYTLYIDDKESPIYTWHKYKIELKNLIEKYFIATFNPGIEFNKEILEQSGLECCRSCLQKNNS